MVKICANILYRHRKTGTNFTLLIHYYSNHYEDYATFFPGRCQGLLLQLFTRYAPMQVKDYYGILEIPPAASDAQVKKSFRRLAMLHHPDRHPGNAMAEAKFREIREAYEVLNDPAKRETYNYQRWYRKSLHREFSAPATTASALAGESRRLRRYLDNVNRFSIDFDALSFHLRQLLSDSSIAILRETPGQDFIAEVASAVLSAAALLPYPYIQAVSLRLNLLVDGRADLQPAVRALVEGKAREFLWGRYRTAVVISVTLLICLLIYFLGS